MDGVELLKRAEEAGLIVTCVGDNLGIHGPKSAENIVREITAHKSEVMAILRDGTLAPVKAGELRARLRKGIDWFVAVDPKLWDENDYPVAGGSRLPIGWNGSALETKMMDQLLKWLELERLLRTLYEYKGCIYDSGECPDDSPVKCSGCV